ncbi:MAG: hypothetical protein II719_07405, partial [Clostridia bacterium]|nr:hypothetical protein [Clostridia bacterium]
MRKKNALIPACLLLLLLAASCGETPAAPAPSTDTESVPGTEQATETQTEEATDPGELKPGELKPVTVYPEPDIPEDLTYEGQTFRFSTNWQAFDQLTTEGLTGELINDTTFNRNLMVEERFGVRVESVFTPNHNADLAKISAAGDTSFDMVYGVAAL